MAKIQPESFAMHGSSTPVDLDSYADYKALLNSEKTEKEKAERLRGFALSIPVKRALFKDCEVEVSRSCCERCNDSCGKCSVKCKNCMHSLELWSHHLVIIEGMFGAGVRSFFSLLRSLLYLNGFLFILFLAFLIVPQAFNSSDLAEQTMLTSLLSQSALAYNCSNVYSAIIYNQTRSQGTSTNFLDFLSGTGWMEKTLLFFGGYFPTSISLTFMVYNYPLAYITVIGVSFIASIILLLIFTGRSFKNSIVSEKQIGVSCYCNTVLSGWDYSMKDKKNADLKSNMLYNEIFGKFRDDEHEAKLRNMTQGQRCGLYAIRGVINILILAMLGGAGYLIYFVQLTSSDYTSSDLDSGSFLRLLMEYLPSLTIAAIGAIFPIIFNLLVKLEDYTSETTVLLTLVRIVFVKLFSIVVLVISLYSVVTCSSKDYCNVGTGTCKSIKCWETYVGQQFYKLTITQFLVFFIVTFGVEGVRALIVKNCSCKLAPMIGLPEFDIPKCVLDLIYVQIITWFGTLFCPMLPGIATVTLICLFYLKLFACHWCYKPSEIPFKTTRSNFFFLIVLMFAFFLCFIPIGYCIVAIPTSKTCGPFRTLSTMYKVIPTTIAVWPSWLNNIVHWVGSAAFVTLIFIILFMVIYYHSTMAATRRSLNRRLQDQVNAESRMKQRYFRQLVDSGLTPQTRARSVPHKKPPPAPATNGAHQKPEDIPKNYEHEGWE